MSATLSEELSRTRALFEHWRATRSGRGKIPEELWQAVIALRDRYSASQLCRELHLSATRGTTAKPSSGRVKRSPLATTPPGSFPVLNVWHASVQTKHESGSAPPTT